MRKYILIAIVAFFSFTDVLAQFTNNTFSHSSKVFDLKKSNVFDIRGKSIVEINGVEHLLLLNPKMETIQIYNFANCKYVNSLDIKGFLLLNDYIQYFGVVDNQIIVLQDKRISIIDVDFSSFTTELAKSVQINIHQDITPTVLRAEKNFPVFKKAENEFIVSSYPWMKPFQNSDFYESNLASLLSFDLQGKPIIKPLDIKYCTEYKQNYFGLMNFPTCTYNSEKDLLVFGFPATDKILVYEMKTGKSVYKTIRSKYQNANCPSLDRKEYENEILLAKHMNNSPAYYNLIYDNNNKVYYRFFSEINTKPDLIKINLLANKEMSVMVLDEEFNIVNEYYFSVKKNSEFSAFTTKEGIGFVNYSMSEVPGFANKFIVDLIKSAPTAEKKEMELTILEVRPELLNFKMPESINEDDFVRVNIFDINGRLIQSDIALNNNIETGNLQPGVYIIELVSSNNRYTNKFVKK